MLGHSSSPRCPTRQPIFVSLHSLVDQYEPLWNEHPTCRSLANSFRYSKYSSAEYYLNPLGNISWNMGASEFDTNMQMTLDTPTQFTINVNYVTSIRKRIHQNASRRRNGFHHRHLHWSHSAFTNCRARHFVIPIVLTLASGTKYKVGLNDGTTWLIYGFPSSGSFSLSQSGANLVSSSQFTGIIQIAKIPIGDTTSEALYDANSGTYVTGMQLFGSTSGSTGTYGYTFTAAGNLKFGSTFRISSSPGFIQYHYAEWSYRSLPTVHYHGQDACIYRIAMDYDGDSTHRYFIPLRWHGNYSHLCHRSFGNSSLCGN